MLTNILYRKSVNICKKAVVKQNKVKPDLYPLEADEYFLFIGRIVVYPITTLALLAASGPAFTVTDTASPTTYGTLSHFDAINDTGQPTNGFEIELEGVAPGDVFDTFGDPANPYIRYGKAAVIERNSTGTIVRYASPYDPVSKMFTQTTPAAPLTYPATLGHQCYALGDPGYPTSGCEHFGVTVNGNPTKTTYRWLVGDATTGTLKVAGSKRSV